MRTEARCSLVTTCKEKGKILPSSSGSPKAPKRTCPSGADALIATIPAPRRLLVARLSPVKDAARTAPVRPRTQMSLDSARVDRDVPLLPPEADRAHEHTVLLQLRFAPTTLRGSTAGDAVGWLESRRYQPEVAETGSDRPLGDSASRDVDRLGEPAIHGQAHLAPAARDRDDVAIACRLSEFSVRILDRRQRRRTVRRGGGLRSDERKWERQLHCVDETHRRSQSRPRT